MLYNAKKIEQGGIGNEDAQNHPYYEFSYFGVAYSSGYSTTSHDTAFSLGTFYNPWVAIIQTSLVVGILSHCFWDSSFLISGY